MRDDILTIFAFLSLLVACGSPQNVLEVTNEDTTFLHQSVHFVRYNPCGCIINKPQLDFEVRTNQTWRRIYLNVPEAEENTFEALRQYVLREPRTKIEITGSFSGEYYRWGAEHYAPELDVETWSGSRKSPTERAFGTERSPENDVLDSNQGKSVLD